jgi:hypothetical protein
VHWPDLNTLTYWGLILGAVVAIGTILGWFLKPLHWLRSRFKSKGQRESISLIFVQNDQHCQWSTALLNNQPGTHLCGRWYVTNNSERNVMILKARLAQHPTHHAQLVTRHPEKREYFKTNYPVMSRQMSEVVVHLTFFPPIRQGHEPIVGDVIFTDNFGNEYRVPSRFFYVGPDMPI